VECLLEREEDLAALEGAVAAARDGRGSLVLVGGEAGIGKTTLMRALRARLGERLAMVVGACEPLSVPVPLQPLRELAAGAGAGDLAELEGGDRLALARSLLSALQSGGVVVAVIEDAHWADPGTLDVVRLLARRIEDEAVVVVVTYRDDELAANQPLALLVGDLMTGPAVRRIALRPLSDAAIVQLAGPSGVDPALVARVTGGNPFLVVEAVSAGGTLPASVRAATLARVGRLGPAARGVVDAAAIIGQRVQPAVLDAVAPDCTAAVEEALARGVLTDDGRTLGFRHELIRQAVEESISAPRRAQLHCRVVAALVDAGAGDHARLAHHAEQAGLAREAGRFATLAAAEAERVGALSEAGLQLGRALRLSSNLAAPERLELLLRFARATNFSGRMDDALAAAEEGVVLAARIDDPLSEGRALMMLAAARWSVDAVDAARDAALAAIELLARADDGAMLARAHATYVRMEAIAFDPDVAIEAAPRALELATGCAMEEARVDVLISVGLARAHRGEADAHVVLAEALAAALSDELPLQTIRAYVNAIGAAADARDFATVQSLSAPALALFDDYQSTPPRDDVFISLGRALLDRGRWDEAIEHTRSGRRRWHGSVALALAVEGLVAARRGEPGALALLGEAWESIAGVPEGWRHGIVRAAQAEAAWLRGDRPAVIAQVRDWLGTPVGRRLARSAGELALWSARCGEPVEMPANAPQPILLELSGDWRGAVRAWQAVHAPYEAALAALPGDDRAAHQAVATLRRLGAAAAARAFAREREARGHNAPRGPRASTLANAAGLTRREQEVLTHVARGATNGTIAAALHLSERTVAHHVSAILAKLDASTRTAAVDAARSRGLLAQDGPPPPPT
jgi:DNA-binding CsgD family transcriptional regulator/tetratricopeptide (TPR) repeat protein